MTRPAGSAPVDSGDRRMTAIYLRVIVVEMLVIAALWLLGRAFS